MGAEVTAGGALERMSQPVPAGVGSRSQGTVIESTRAAAEVAAAVQVAKAYPRSESDALSAMRAATDRWRLAEAAQFAYSRGGNKISGPTIQLARELARIWGNLQYGLTELDRDHIGGRSEMLAFAWDVETNARASTTFIVEHVREVNKQRVPLASDRDVYENNANMGARRVREQIYAMLPRWYTDEAIDRCIDRLKRPKDGGDPIPFAQRLLNLEAGFGQLGVTRAQLEDRQGSHTRWTELDVASLGVLFRTIQRGETTVLEEFPPVGVSLDEVARPAATSAGRVPAAAPDPSAAAGAPSEADLAAAFELEQERQREDRG